MQKRRPSLVQPTQGELEILHVLWRIGAATVRTVNEELSKGKDVGYTTTLKIMQIMFDKKMVSREAHGRGHLYSPLIKQNEVQELLVNKLLDTAFGGSAKQLVMQALGNQKSSIEELSEIKAFIAEIEKGSKR